MGLGGLLDCGGRLECGGGAILPAIPSWCIFVSAGVTDRSEITLY